MRSIVGRNSWGPKLQLNGGWEIGHLSFVNCFLTVCPRDIFVVHEYLEVFNWCTKNLRGLNDPERAVVNRHFTLPLLCGVWSWHFQANPIDMRRDLLNAARFARAEINLTSLANVRHFLSRRWAWWVCLILITGVLITSSSDHRVMKITSDPTGKWALRC